MINFEGLTDDEFLDVVVAHNIEVIQLLRLLALRRGFNTALADEAKRRTQLAANIPTDVKQALDKLFAAADGKPH